MNDDSKHVGLDVHGKTIAVAVAQAGREEVRFWGTISNRPDAVRKLVDQFADGGASLCFWYEAGPCGYGVYRQITAMGHACRVVAPTRIPRASGDRVKTDRRDAMMLARLGRANELKSVWVPGVEQEALRDLTRCREDAKRMQRQARQQLGAFLLRHGRHYDTGKTKWTKTFSRWLCEQKFESPAQQLAFQMYVDTVDAGTERVAMLDKQIEQCVETYSLRPVIEALKALRGVDSITATTILAELGDITRFDSPRQLMSFLGLVPSEHTSGDRTRRGPITKTGNGHVRRVLVESAWCYRFPARKTRHLQRKARAAPAPVQAIAWKAQVRLCGRYRHLIERGKLKTQACTAIARELCGFIWAIARQVMASDTSSRCGEPSAAL